MLMSRYSQTSRYKSIMMKKNRHAQYREALKRKDYNASMTSTNFSPLFTLKKFQLVKIRICMRSNKKQLNSLSLSFLGRNSFSMLLLEKM